VAGHVDGCETRVKIVSDWVDELEREAETKEKDLENENSGQRPLANASELSARCQVGKDETNDGNLR
jgi:hypothetical protein